MNKDVIFPAILHGADYNPDQWPEEVWDDDIRLMQEAHVNVATLPVFSWANLQPAEDIFNFEWLDRILAKLHAGGIGVCLCTSTAAQPAWLDRKYPDALRVGADGRRMRHQGRVNFCTNSPNFRRLATGLVRRLAERYKEYPGLLLWHIANEYGNYCYCDLCGAAFREWLKAKYGTIEELNRVWYANFWGHTYTDWLEIETPTYNGERTMEALLIDYDRFQSDSILACYQAEAAVLREITPQIPITTNLMGTFKPLDYHKWARSMDIVSWDSYPRRGYSPPAIAFQHSVMRGLKEGAPFMMMEQTPSQVSWAARCSLSPPGQVRLLAYQSMAHGADTVMYFQWRRGRGSFEKFHGAVVEHIGTNEPRVFQEIAALGKELENLGTRTLGGRVPARVAVLFDWDNWWAIEYCQGPSVDLKYVDRCMPYFQALHALGILVDVVSPDADLSQYGVVIAPMLYMVKPGIAEKLAEFTRAGGTFITTYFSGIVDENSLVTLGGYPGPLSEMLGIWVEEIDALMEGVTNEVVMSEAFGAMDGAYPCRYVCDLIHARGADVLATYGKDFYAGEPAITRNRFGAGCAYYLGTELDQEGLMPLLAKICADKGITGLLPDAPPSGVEVSERVSPSGEPLLYVLNHNQMAVDVTLPSGQFTDLLTGGSHGGKTELVANGVLILAREA